ncbi:MAG: iron-sulfur cluster assembly protein, partial [Chloroflexota bacterium]|nr:iron-sulfur cluster assembly protein [Chloroflexota bacterium]
GDAGRRPRRGRAGPVAAGGPHPRGPPAGEAAVSLAPTWPSPASVGGKFTSLLQLETGQLREIKPYNGNHMAQEMIDHEYNTQIADDTQLISITDSALGQLRDLLQKQGRPEMGLRVFVQPGGCSGMSYGMGFEDRPEEGDAVSEVGGVRLFVDSVSARYIKGAEIDFVDSLMGGGFTVHNPNAVSSCSCGSSFDTGGDAGTAHGCSH